MQKPDFSLTRHWLLLAVATLAVSGIAPLVLLAGRGSALAEKAVIRATFHDALVVHVDLSAVAWFLAIALMFWASLAEGAKPRIPYLRGASLGCFAVGCLAIAVAPLLQDGMPLMSNYIPVYTSPLFFLGLSLLAASLVMGIIDTFLPSRAPVSETGRIERFGILGSAFIVLLALVHFVWSHARLQAPMHGSQEYYELLFWAGGHILQLAYTQLLLVAWLRLAAAAGVETRLKPGILMALFSLYPLIALASPIAFLNGSQPYDLGFFTQQMRQGGGLGAAILGGYLIYALARTRLPGMHTRAAWLCLAVSITVFAVGGFIGHTIEGSNTIIPAHYHGSIVGTTLAFMGVVYLLLPQMGYGDIAKRKLTLVQPLLYGGGSLLHAAGLAIAGGHGVQRKTVGAMANAPEAADIAMHVGRFGGALAILGGAVFVTLVVISVRRKPSSAGTYS